MLRKLVIKFTQDGDFFREIDEERNYFLCEAEAIVEKIRQRLLKEKRSAAPKPFEFWLDGQLMIISYVSFDKKLSFHKELEQTILSNAEWDEEIRHQYVNLLKLYVEEEQHIWLNRELQAFMIRFDQLFGASNYEPFPLMLDITHLSKLFVAITPYVTTSLYSELEKMMASIQTTMETIMQEVAQETQLMEEATKHYFRDEEAFGRLIQYFVACFQSVSKARIDALCPHFELYQRVEMQLFQGTARMHGFTKAYHLHSLLHRMFQERFDAVLFQGFALRTDEMVETLVIVPILQLFQTEYRDFLEVSHDEDATITHLSEC